MTELSTHVPSSRLPLVDACRKHAGFITGWLFWSDFRDYERGTQLFGGFCGPQWDEFFIAFGVMSCGCPATGLISVYPPLIIDFSVLSFFLNARSRSWIMGSTPGTQALTHHLGLLIFADKDNAFLLFEFA